MFPWEVTALMMAPSSHTFYMQGHTDQRVIEQVRGRAGTRGSSEGLLGGDWSGEVTHVGHDEPLLGLVRGARVLLAKAQADLVLGLWVTILQVGPQFYGH